MAEGSASSQESFAEFYSKIRTISKDEETEKVQDKKNNNWDVVKQDVEWLVGEIMKDMKDKILNAAKEKKKDVIVYSYIPGQTAESAGKSRINFLLKGSQYKGIEVFTAKGIVPVVTQIEKLITPFKVSITWTPRERKSNVLVSWEPLKEQK